MSGYQPDVCAFAGVGTTDFRAAFSAKGVRHSADDLAADAFTAALGDAGLTAPDIDGLITVRLRSYDRFAVGVGLREVSFVSALPGEGRMTGVAIQQAMAAIAAGLATRIAIVYGNDGRSAGASYGGQVDPHATYQAMYGLTSPGAHAALMFRRHMHQFGTRRDVLADIAISNRAHAGGNPIAVFTDPLTDVAYQASRYIAAPLRLYDYCVINDGGVALIITATQPARDTAKGAVPIAGVDVSTDLGEFYTSPDLFYGACQRAGQRLYERTALGPSDVSSVAVYDNFTPIVLLALEGFGYCPRGEAGRWLTPELIGPGGDLPLNTSGGHTSEGYLQGFGLLAEAVRQLRGEAGQRQVPGCEVIQYMCAAPIVNSIMMRADR